MKKINKVEQLVLDTIMEKISSNVKVYRRDIGLLVLEKFDSAEAALEFAKQDKRFEEDARLLESRRLQEIKGSDGEFGKHDIKLDDKAKWTAVMFFEWVLNRFVGRQKNCKTKPLLVKSSSISIDVDTFYKNPNYVA